jgi:cytochrome c-type biogenesis protein
MISDISSSLVEALQTGLAPAVAFLAGVVSFASPCVFPLVPGYLSFVTGGQALGIESRRRLLPIFLFIGGFTLVFTLLGAFASTFVQIFKDRPGQIVAGAVMVVVGGLMVGYAARRGSIVLYAERRPFLQSVRPGVAGAFPLGMAFAAGWTPCIGPVLAGILVIASTGGTAKGAFLLACYSLGLGLPFLLIGLGAQKLVDSLSWIQRNYRVIAGVSGTLLILVGILVATGEWTRRLAPLLNLWQGI